MEDYSYKIFINVLNLILDFIRNINFYVKSVEILWVSWWTATNKSESFKSVSASNYVKLAIRIWSFPASSTYLEIIFSILD